MRLQQTNQGVYAGQQPPMQRQGSIEASMRQAMQTPNVRLVIPFVSGSNNATQSIQSLLERLVASGSVESNKTNY